MKSLKQKIEEAAGKYWEADNRNLDGVNPYAYTLGFKTGASHLYRNGYQFTAEDMAVFADWYSMNWDLDFKPDAALGQWLKEREQR